MELLRFDFFVESVDGDHSGWPLQALEAGDGGVEDFVGKPQVPLVLILVAVTSLCVDGPATRGDEWSDASEQSSLLISDGLCLRVLHILPSTANRDFDTRIQPLSKSCSLTGGSQESVQSESGGDQRSIALPSIRPYLSGEVQRW